MKKLPEVGDSVIVKKRAAKCPIFGDINKQFVGCIGEVIEVYNLYLHPVLVKFPNGLQDWFDKEDIRKVK